MRSILFTFIALYFAISLSGQSVTFENAIVLFDHPNEPSSDNFSFGLPFIPYDYNSDGNVDFIGNSFDDAFIVKGLGNNLFDIVEDPMIGAPLFVMDFDMDGDEDVIMERYVKLYTDGDDFESLTMDIFFPEQIKGIKDFNQDGYFDILSKDRVSFGDEFFVLRLNNGDNTFTSSVVYEDEVGFRLVEVGDVDNDGDFDIVTITSGGSEDLTVLWNNGMNEFSPQIIEPPSSSFNFDEDKLILLDIDNDMDLDIITGNYNHGIYIFENVDNFSTPEISEIVLFGLQLIQIGDLNNDGAPDLLSINGTGNGFKLNYHLNDEAGNFGEKTIIETFPGSNFVGFPTNLDRARNNLSVYDYDDDGKNDLIYVNGTGTGDKQIVLLKNISNIEVGLSDLSTTDNPISIFPNPVNDFLHVVRNENRINENESWKLINANGQVVRKGKFTSIESPSKISMASFPSGIYFLEVSTPSTSRSYVVYH